MRKGRINLLNNKYIIACHIELNKGTKVFFVPPVEYHCSGPVVFNISCSRTPDIISLQLCTPRVVVFKLYIVYNLHKK
jgi:hypothetical protein